MQDLEISDFVTSEYFLIARTIVFFIIYIVENEGPFIHLYRSKRCDLKQILKMLQIVRKCIFCFMKCLIALAGDNLALVDVRKDN